MGPLPGMGSNVKHSRPLGNMLKTIDFIGFCDIRRESLWLEPAHRLHRLESARKGLVGVPQSACGTAAKGTPDGDIGRGGTSRAKGTIAILKRTKKVQNIKPKTGDRTKAR